MDAEIEFLKLVRKLHESNPELCKKVAKAVFRYKTDKAKVLYISEKASRKAQKMRISLSDKNWHNQPKFDKGRKIFQYEHCNTIGDLTKDIFDGKRTIKAILNDDITCWITKYEDRKLTNKGYRSERNNRGGYELCYEKCGIKILENK